VFKSGQTVPEEVLGVIAFSVLKALHYLHSELKVIHRDVKPSNILINRNGCVKMCDFGISGRLVNSLAKTQVGCQNYMAPERVIPSQDSQGFSVTSDVWSFGITMVEVATGKFPYDNWRTMFDQIKQVVEGDAPRLPSGHFSQAFGDFVSSCLQKDFRLRPKYAQLLSHPFIQQVEVSNIDISDFVSNVISSISGMH
jgi:serine/threonine protein kinase